MTEVTIPTALPDSNADGVIDVSAKGAKRYGVPKAGKWWGPLPGKTDFTYSDVQPGVPVTPPESQPDTLTGRNARGEVFLQNAALTIGINIGGALGTFEAAPAGFRNDAAHGRLRVGFLPVGGSDLIMPGRLIEGFAVSYGGRSYANMPLTSLSQIPGTLAADGSWTGTTPDGLHIEQRVRLDGAGVVYDVTLTNRGTKPITGLRYMRAVDPDTDDSYATSNVVGPVGTVTATLSDGRRFSLGSDDPRAWASYGGFVTADPRTIVRVPVGIEKRADVTLQMVVELGKLAVGASATVRLSERIEE